MNNNLNDYQALKVLLGRTPTLSEYLNFDSKDILQSHNSRRDVSTINILKRQS